MLVVLPAVLARVTACPERRALPPVVPWVVPAVRVGLGLMPRR